MAGDADEPTSADQHGKPEEDVENDDHEARSRAGGDYVGRTIGEDETDVGESGAERRASAAAGEEN